ncbi:hypothetical protein TNCV_4624241 [Trichonephila clavipes]|nr:hypothetical protein TNCV_4624241 [Trichonephila clavipes]
MPIKTHIVEWLMHVKYAKDQSPYVDVVEKLGGGPSGQRRNGGHLGLPAMSGFGPLIIPPGLFKDEVLDGNKALDPLEPWSTRCVGVRYVTAIGHGHELVAGVSPVQDLAPLID